jgi:exo-1,4-beta-D-glucosaminidase
MNRSFWSSALFLLMGQAPAAAAFASGSRQVLQDGWRLESSCKITETGERISAPEFRPQGWHPASVPTTVLAALVADQTFPDPYFGMNLRQIPGTDYPIGKEFANLPMSSTSPFHCSWWYRKEFTSAPAPRDGRTWLSFDGINYRANIWLNGRKLADAADIAGAWRAYEIDVTTAVRPGRPNALAVEVFAPRQTDLAITWVDWNPTPADKNMGLFKPVFLTRSGPVALRRPQVTSDLDPSLKSAALTVTAELRNSTSRPVKGLLQADWEGRSVRQTVELGPQESRRVELLPQQHPQLRMRNPRLWWPYQMGRPELHTMRLKFAVSGVVSDAQRVDFGIRRITSELTPEGARLFKVNGRKILIRGGGWSPDMLLRFSPRRLAAELAYVRHLGLNTVRLEGKLERDEFFDLADRLGILVMAGWCCCDMWEDWDHWQAEQHRIAGQSLQDQIARLRNHPSLLVWLNGSDGPPPPDVEKLYLDVLKAQGWPNPVLSSASGSSTTVTGDSGVKMSGPYDYVPPGYWLADTKRGGAFGFNTETSPGPAIPTKESLCRMLPAEHRWPIDAFWDYHAGGNDFANTDIFDKALEQRYGRPRSLEEFALKSQAMTYEGQRAMFEAYARNKFAATGVIQWMLNNAWPSTIWHLYDYYLVPGGGYFGTKKACERVHVQYSYDDHSIVVVNGSGRLLKGMKVDVKAYNLDGSAIFSQSAALDAPADSSTRVLVLPELPGATTTYFLKLSLRGRDGKEIGENFYWLSTKADVVDLGNKSSWYYTPQTVFADFTALNGLAPARLRISASPHRRGAEASVSVTAENTGSSVAFMVHLRLADKEGGTDISPVLWDDNYFSLLPGEKRTIAGLYQRAALGGHPPILEVDGWNVAAQSLAMGQRSRSSR